MNDYDYGLSDGEHYELYGDRCATIPEAIREWAHNVGAEYPDRAWLNSNYDTWEKNPFYSGPPVPHPEADEDGDRQDAFFEPGESSSPTVWLGLTPVAGGEVDDHCPF